MGPGIASEILHYTPALLKQAAERRERLRRFSEAAARQQQQKLAPSQMLAVMAPVIAADPAPIKRRQYETAHAPTNSPISIRIINAVAAEFGMTRTELCSQLRDEAHCMARFFAIGLLIEMTQLSFPAIGRRLGGRDHTTVLHGSKRAKQLFASEAVRNRLDQIKAEIGA